MAHPRSPDAPDELGKLLDNATWLRALARQMLADRGLAEDAVQETWVAALRAGPELAIQRPWLARVVRNFALQRGRSESARKRREGSVARPERTPSAEEVVARAELHAKLVQAVLALEEPYRSTILWRYFENQSAEEIAARAGIDPATVRSRVARAREKLRAALMVHGGEPPERWLAALLPYGSDVGVAPIAVGSGVLAGVGGSLMSTKLGVGVCATLLLAAVLVWRGTGSKEPRAVQEPAAVAASAPLLETSRSAPELDAAPAADRRAAVAAEAAAERSVAARAATWHGLVRSDAGLAPIEGARIAYRRGSEIDSHTPEESATRTREVARSDAAGRFELPISADREDGLWITAEGHFGFKLSAGDLPRDGLTPIEVALAPLGRIELEIVDDTLAPHADLPVSYSIDVNRGSQDFMWSYRRSFSAGRTDENGRLVIAGVPCGMQVQFRQGTDGLGAKFLGVVVVDPGSRVLRHQVKLARTATITGRLVASDGAALAGVALEWQSYPLHYGQPERARSGDDGDFTFSGVAPKPGELRLDVSGFDPRELAPGIGETIDLGTLVVPELLELSGRLSSRWSDASRSGTAFGGVTVRILRGGRLVEPLKSNEGALPLSGGVFSTSITDGPLELIVSRGGYWHSGMTMPREVLARVSLPEPRPGLVIPIDDALGALDVQLEASGVAAQEELHLVLYSGIASGAPAYALSMDAALDAEGRVRFAPLTPGRYRGTLRCGKAPTIALGEFEILAAQATSIVAPPPQSMALLGRVRDARGAAVSAASVRWRGMSSQGTSASDAQGSFRIDALEPGLIDIEVRHGDFGVEIRRDLPVFEAQTRLDVVLAGFVTVVGRVRVDGRAAKQLAIGAQPVASNDTYSALTDEQGEFRLEHLPACRLRLWAQGKFVEVLELEAGETRTLEFEVGAARPITFTRDGVAIEDLHGAHALGFDAASGSATRWLTGQLHRNGVEIECPAGRVLFVVSRARSGSNVGHLALVERAGAEVELARHTLVLESAGAPSNLPPRANLVSIEGRAIVSMWGGEIVLAVERDAQGRAIVPCLPNGARVRLSGSDSKGARHEALVDVAQTLRVTWP